MPFSTRLNSRELVSKHSNENSDMTNIPQQNSNYFLDDVDLFSTTADNGAFTATDSYLLNGPIRTNSLIDSPVPNLQTDKLIDWTNEPPKPSGSWKNPNFVDDWPELQSVNVEHKVQRSSSGSTSSQKDLIGSLSRHSVNADSLVAPTNGYFFNGSLPLGIANPAAEKNPAFGDVGWGQQTVGNRPVSKSANFTGFPLPPRIEQRKTALRSAPPAILSNGFAPAAGANSSVRYQRIGSSTSTKFDDFNGVVTSGSEGMPGFTDVSNCRNDCRGEDCDEEDDDEVFLHMGSAASVLTPLTGGANRKKKVRFFEDGNKESELLVGAAPPSSNAGAAVTLRKGRSCGSRMILLSMTLAIILAIAATVIVLIYIPWKGRSTASKIRLSPITRSGGLCTTISAEYVGNISVYNVYPTSALTAICVKGGRCKDTIVFGYGSTVAVPCYGSSECRGGVAAIAIDSGDFVWRYSTFGEVNGANCRHDLNGDGVADCVVSGKRGVLSAVSGVTGDPLWDASIDRPDAEFFLPQLIPDMDDDGAPEVLATAVVRTEDNTRLCLLSGKTGRAYLKDTPYVLNLRSMDTVVPSMLWQHGESLSDVIISAGSFRRRGGLYDYALQSVLLMRLEQGKLIYNNSVLVPPVFADVNGDSFGDMVFCTTSGELVAVDGVSIGNILWKFKPPQGECASQLLVGNIDKDPFPDIAVTYCFGEGFPLYGHCETVFVNGKTGKEVDGRSRVRSLLPPTASGLTISTNSYAGDVFLVWRTSCGGAQESVSYRFVETEPNSWRDFGWSNICQKLFGTRITYQLLAVSAGVISPMVVFDSSLQDLDEELEKFASVLKQLDPGFMYSADKRMVASVQLGPAGLLIAEKSVGMADSIELYLPSFVSVSSPLEVVPDECFLMNGNPQSCNGQLGRIVQQPVARPFGFVCAAPAILVRGASIFFRIVDISTFQIIDNSTSLRI